MTKSRSTQNARTLGSRRAQRLLRQERGFSLIEILVVTLIIGILAAIALPAFLGQRARGQDAKAKSDARNLVSELEGCFATEQTYAAATCNITAANSSLPLGSGVTQVEQTAGDTNGYTVVARSGNGGSTFSIAKNAAALTYACGNPGSGGCPATSDWR